MCERFPTSFDFIYQHLLLRSVVEICLQIKSKPGSQSVPLELASVGQCSDQRAEFRLNYSYNESSMFPPAALSNVSVILPVTAPVSAIIQSTPNGTW